MNKTISKQLTQSDDWIKNNYTCKIKLKVYYIKTKLKVKDMYMNKKNILTYFQ